MAVLSSGVSRRSSLYSGVSELVAEEIKLVSLMAFIMSNLIESHTVFEKKNKKTKTGSVFYIHISTIHNYYIHNIFMAYIAIVECIIIVSGTYSYCI